jgi:hypothetical protein
MMINKAKSKKLGEKNVPVPFHPPPEALCLTI